MKNIILFSFVLGLLSLMGCRRTEVEGVRQEAEYGTVVHGNASFDHKKFESLTVNGKLEIEDVEVLQALQVNGFVNIDTCKLYDVQVNGRVKFDDSIVSGIAEINGQLDIEQCKVNELHISTDVDKLEFDDCIIGTLVIKKSKAKEQKIILNDSVVQKTITFEADDGTVVLTGSSKIEGNVSGGKIVNN